MNIQTKNNTQIQKLAKTIMTAYQINPDDLVSSNNYVAKETHQEATETWIKDSLLNLDEKLTDSVLPILVDRFEEYLADRKFI